MMDVFNSLVGNWRVGYEMSVREMRVVTKGTYLGIAWIAMRPLFQVAVYVFILTVIFNIRLGEGAGTFDFALYVLAGLVPWWFIARVMEESTMLVRSKVDLLKQVAYPIETLPMEPIIIQGVGFLVGFVVFAILTASTGRVPMSWVLLPLPVVITLCFAAGIAWVFMLVGVVLKDLREILGIVFSFIIFVSPVLIQESAVSPLIWKIILFNPLSHFVLSFRDVLEGTFHPLSWVVSSVLALTTLAMGAWLVSRAKTVINEYL